MRPAIIIAILVGSIFLVVGFWRLQGAGMKGSFIKAMKNGEVHMTMVNMVDKVWTEDEYKTVKVLRLPDSYGVEQAWSREIHMGGRYTIGRALYSCQGQITDLETGMIHMFGYTKSRPHRWLHQGFHPDSAAEMLERLQETGSRY